jgi:hypothetical protein
MRFKTLRELYMHQWHEDHFGPIFNYNKTYATCAVATQLRVRRTGTDGDGMKRLDINACS